MVTRTRLICWPDGRQELVEEEIPETAGEETPAEGETPAEAAE